MADQRTKGGGRVVNRAELAKIFDVVPSTINKWQQIGMPVRRKGSRGIPDQFNSADCLWWRIAYLAREPADNDLSSLAHRKLVAVTSIKEHVAERAMRSVVPVDWFTEAQEEVFEIVREELSRIAPAAAKRVAQEQGVVRCRNVLDEAVNDARSAIVARAGMILKGS